MNQLTFPTKEKLEGLLTNVQLPRFAKVICSNPSQEIENVDETVSEAIVRGQVFSRIIPGQNIAVAVGSREIDRMRDVVRAVIYEIKRAGGVPFIVPAMGSHGGATAEGQRHVLESYGVTEEYTGAPIRASMDTEYLGLSESGLKVYMDKNACHADWTVLIGRIKPHTDFRGKVESGLMKMMAIGLGKQYGAAICHQQGFHNMGKNVWEFGKVFLEKANILCGIGVIENGEHRLNRIEAIPAEDIPECEPGLLVYARSLMHKIPFDDLDLLIVSELGKEYSGCGMDPNITGRSVFLGDSYPHPRKIAVLDLTEKSAGNASGMGLADSITEKMFKKVDLEPVYVNSITSRDTQGLRFPAIMPSDELAIKMCMQTNTYYDLEKGPRCVWIKNTLNINTILVSEALKDEIAGDPNLTLCGEWEKISFDDDGYVNAGWKEKMEV